MLTGSFVHNQRVKCMWKDMHQSLRKLFYHLFYYLEEMRLLDLTNEIHIYSLHYVYIRAETNIQFTRIFARLHKYSNTNKVFGYTENALFLTYFVINYKF